MGVPMDVLISALRAETADLDRLVQADVWDLPTPAVGWAVRDQIAHLAWFDEAAARAVRAPDAFRAETREALRNGLDADALVAERRGAKGPELRDWVRSARDDLTGALAAADPRTRVPWYGPDMGLTSFTTARLMETWAHGQDVVDGLRQAGYDADRPPTGSLRHVAEIGVRALPWSFTVRGRDAPRAPVRVELTLPDGTPWTAGPEDAADLVRGPALDFCLVVTQRRHPADVHLVISGPVAAGWISIAQAFAGPPGTGRRPGQFA